MNYCLSCGTEMRYLHDKHRHDCFMATQYGWPRHEKRVVPIPAALIKCTCGSGNRPLKGAGHSDWCDVERMQ